MAPDINIAHADFALWGTEDPSAQFEKWLDFLKEPWGNIGLLSVSTLFE